MTAAFREKGTLPPAFARNVMPSAAWKMTTPITAANAPNTIMRGAYQGHRDAIRPCDREISVLCHPGGMDQRATPTVAGERVTLRECCDDDVELVLSVVNDPLIPLITSVPAAGDVTAVRAYIERQRNRAVSGEGFQFVIVDNSSGTAVGQVGLTFRELSHERASVGYWIAPQHRQQGFAVAARRAIAYWALEEQAVQRLELYVEPWNEGSWRAAETAGFAREGLLRGWEQVGPERRDMYMYSLLHA